MSAKDRLDEFDRQWPAFQRSLREGKLRVLVVTSSIGLGESKMELPSAMVPHAQDGLIAFAAKARLELVVAAIQEARRTLEELDK